MIIFNWKYPEKGQYPPEPQVTKDGWKLDDPEMSPVEIMEWYEAHFEMYACRLFGEDGPVPAQLYYIGDNEFMSETGHVSRKAWSRPGTLIQRMFQKNPKSHPHGSASRSAKRASESA
jgi:hypothetical protein